MLLASGGDSRGLVYAVLELADRVRHAADPFAPLAAGASIAECPAKTVRAVSRLFTSDVEDEPWFNDRSMWPQYLFLRTIVDYTAVLPNERLVNLEREKRLNVDILGAWVPHPRTAVYIVMATSMRTSFLRRFGNASVSPDIRPDAKSS